MLGHPASRITKVIQPTCDGNKQMFSLGTSIGADDKKMLFVGIVSGARGNQQRSLFEDFIDP